MKRAVVLLLLLSTPTASSFALDVGTLPDGCRMFVDASKANKPRYAQLSSIMNRAGRTKDVPNFCAAAKGALALVVDENERLDQCLGELASDKTLPQSTVGQFTQIKEYYRKIIAASKDSANDHVHCGLASQ